MRIPADTLRRVIGETFQAAGCTPEEAGRIATYLVKANLTGHDSHGVIRTWRYLKMLSEGAVHANRNITVVLETEGLAVVDGNHGFGQTVGPQVVQLGIAKAKKTGAAIVALRSAGHLGRIGDFAEMAAAAGIVSIHLVNVSGSELVAPYGARERRMSTNPLAIGVPRPGQEPLILDFATSVVAEGKVAVAFDGGATLPAGALIDEHGNLSADPAVFYGPRKPGETPNVTTGKGAIRAMGEHKGSGLSIMMELLAGALTGSGCSGPAPRRFANGMLSIYLDPAVVDTKKTFVAEVGQYVDFIRSAKAITPGGEVLLPGEPERRREAQRLAEGIELPEATWKEILASAGRAGLSQSRIDTILKGQA